MIEDMSASTEAKLLVQADLLGLLQSFSGTIPFFSKETN
jgi:hypothetical protein